MNLLKNKLFLIFILALILRIYKLGEFPVGFHIDEVRVGWNAISIFKTGLDDHRNFLSLYYDSFGDFRPTGIFYFTIPSIIAFGKTVFAVRFSSAFFGAASIFPLYYLSKLILKNERAALLTSLLLAVSVWHIQVSRATSEVVISGFFTIFALYFLLKLIKTNKNKYLFLATLAISISYFLYHAIRFTAPLFYITLIVSNYKHLTKKVFFAFLGVVTLSFFFTTAKEGLQRFDQVSLLNDVDLNYSVTRIMSEEHKKTLAGKIFDNKYSIYTRYFIDNYTSYFSGGFLIGNLARPYRYTTPGVGLISIVEIVLFIVGFFYILRKKDGRILIFLLAIAPLPAALTIEDAPNLHRAMLMLPFMLIIEGYAFKELYKNKFWILTGLTLCTLFFNHMYFNHSQSHRPLLKDFFVDSPTYRNVGVIELVDKIQSLKGNYDKIIVTNFPDNPYPWFAFHTNQNPSEFNQIYNSTTNQKIFENIIFSETKCPTDNSLDLYKGQKLLMIDNWECGYESKIKAGLPIKVVDKVLRSDNSEVYILSENIN